MVALIVEGRKRMPARLTSLLLATSVFAGLLWPQLASFARPLMMPSIFFILVCALLVLERGEVRSALRRERRLLVLICLWQLAVVPVSTAAMVGWLQIPRSLAMALVLSACAGPIFSSAAFARLLGLDAALMTGIVLLTTALTPLALLVWTGTLLTADADLDFAEYFWRVGVFVILPFLLSELARKAFSEQRLTAARPMISAAMFPALVVFAVAVMDGVAARWLEDTRLVSGFLIAAFIFNLGSQLVTALVFRFAGVRRALTAGLAAGYRNLALVLAVAGAMVGPDFAIYVGVGQIPMYVLPLLLTPVYTRLQRGRM